MLTAFLKDHFNDADGVLGLLTKHHEGALPQRAAVVKWFRRNSVPGHWLLVLLVVIERETGVRPSVERYLDGWEHDIFD